MILIGGLKVKFPLPIICANCCGSATHVGGTACCVGGTAHLFIYNNLLHGKNKLRTN